MPVGKCLRHKTTGNKEKVHSALKFQAKAKPPSDKKLPAVKIYQPEPEALSESPTPDAKLQTAKMNQVELLEAAELSQQEIADVACVTRMTVSRAAKSIGVSKMPEAQMTQEDSLAEIASDFAFDPESFFAELEAEPGIILPNEGLLAKRRFTVRLSL